MITSIIRFSIHNKLITGLLLLGFVAWGAWNVTQLPIDALPDVTNNQVIVITNAPDLATQEVEQFITYPLELQLKNMPDLVEMRSISRSGLSVLTVVFKDAVPTNIARQAVTERLKLAEADIPSNYGTPEIQPPTTGLGEIFQYTLEVDSAHREQYDLTELRTIEDWIIRRQLLGVPGVVEVSSFGGKLKQYEVAVDPARLASMDLSVLDVYDALAANNANTGGSYIETGPNVYFIRGEGLLHTLDDIGNVAVKATNGVPVRIKDVGEVRFGYAPRFGAMMRNGEGEVVGGVVLMMKEENANRVIARVKDRMAQIEPTLPEGVHVNVFVDRSKLVGRAIGTVEHNLLMGALIVVLVLVFMLGDWRAGLLVASVIPLSMLFAVSMMNAFGVSANLMSMGALDFGLIVDGAVIVVESLLFLLHQRFLNTSLDHASMDREVEESSARIMRSAVFGQVIILIVYVPIFALIGIEGKMFKPMALTVSFAIIGALLLSLTYVPLMSSLFLSKHVRAHTGWSSRFIARSQKIYRPLLERALRWPRTIIASSLLLLLGAWLLFDRLGGEFIPELDEGDMAANYTIRQGSGLNETTLIGQKLERIIKSFPEVEQVVSKIGTSEVPTDPMPLESADLLIILKERKDWTTTDDKEQLIEMMNDSISAIPGVNVAFEQPIQMRFNELIAGVKSDIAIKLYGEDLDVLYRKGNELASLIRDIPGAVDIRVEQVVGMPQLLVKYDHTRLAQFGLSVATANRILNTALAGGKAGVVYEGERVFDLVVRLDGYRDADIEKVRNIRVPLPNGTQVPLSEVATISFKSAPSQISRDDGERRLVVEVNTRGRDIQSVADDIRARVHDKLKLPAGYYTEYGGTFQNLQEAKGRLLIAVPVALLLIFILLFLSFGSVRDALVIFSAIPLAAVGGVLALWQRDMPFSISAGIGFIALFGVAVLNGIVLISYFNREDEEGDLDIVQRIMKGTQERLRPVLATALVASLGFLPMAMSTSAGSEVQRPLATVVIGGLITSTLLTLFVLPVLYKLFGRRRNRSTLKPTVLTILLLLLAGSNLRAQNTLTLEQAVQLALQQHPTVLAANGMVEREKVLKGTVFTLDPLNVQYQGGEINGHVNDYNLSFGTGIPAPTTIARRARLQQQRIGFAESKAQFTEAQVKREVSNAYIALQHAREQTVALAALDSIYRDFAVFAERRYTLGATGQVESLSARARWEQVELDRQQAEADVLSAEARLRQWTGGSSGTTDRFALLPSPALDTALIAADPELRTLAAQVAVSQAEWKLQRASWAPSIQFGVFDQSLDQVAPFWGYTVGISLPLLKTGRTSIARAAGIDARIAEDQRLAAERSARADLQAATSDYLQGQRQYNFYNEQGRSLSEALLNSASRSYQAGDIGYLEYISTLDQAYRLRTGALTALRDLDRAIIQLNFLTGR